MRPSKLHREERTEGSKAKSFKIFHDQPRSILWIAIENATDRDTQAALIALAEKRAKKATARRVIVFGLIILLVTVGAVFLKVQLMNHITDSIALGALAVVVLLAYLDGRQQRRRAALILSVLLYQKGVRTNRCLRCRYDLKGSASEQCPECGESLAPVKNG